MEVADDPRHHHPHHGHHLWVALHVGSQLYDFPSVHGKRGKVRLQALFDEECAWQRLWPQSPPWDNMMRGVILGVVQFIGAAPGTDRYLDENPWVVRDSFAWIIGEVYRLPKPIPYKGAQGLFTIDEATTGVLRALVRERRV